MIKFAKSINPDEFIIKLKSVLKADDDFSKFINIITDPLYECKVTAKLYYYEDAISAEDTDVDLCATKTAPVNVIPMQFRESLVFRMVVNQNTLINSECSFNSIEFDAVDIHTGERLCSFKQKMGNDYVFKDQAKLEIICNFFLDNPDDFSGDTINEIPL